MRNTRFRLRSLLLSVTFALTALTATSVYAGEIKIGQKELEVDDKGKLTGDGRKAAVTELDNVPGEDMWTAHVWAKLDKGAAEGPLYIEFFQKINGEDSLVHRHEEASFGGDNYISVEIDLEGRIGFNKDRTYSVRAVQVNAKGKDIVLAKGSIKLIKSGKKPEPDEDEGEDEGEDEISEQDAIDSLAGPEDAENGDEEESEGSDEAPPPVEPKKGCSVSTDTPPALGGALLLLAACGVFGLRRRS